MKIKEVYELEEKIKEKGFVLMDKKGYENVEVKGKVEGG